MYVNHKDYRGAAYGPGNAPKVEEKEHSVKVSYTYFLPTIPAAECTLAYEVFGDGRIAGLTDKSGGKIGFLCGKACAAGAKRVS